MTGRSSGFRCGLYRRTMDLAVELSGLMMISILFIGVYYILQGYLQIHGAFLLWVW